MIVKAIYNPNFGDKTTGKTYEEQVKRYPGDIFECEDALAKERIKKGFVVKATKEEIEEYKKQQEEIEKAKEKPVAVEKNEEESKEKEETQNIVKPLEDCTIEELIEIAVGENIELEYPKDETAKEVIIGIINKVREERINGDSNAE